jgi:hypothetical protein
MGACAALIALAAGSAKADDAQVAWQTLSTALMPTATGLGAQVASASDNPFASASLGPAELGSTSGGASTTTNLNATVYAAVSDQTLSATNSGNSVTANTLTTGAVNLGANAFSGFNGIGNFVLNTGNNNNLQGSLSVTILMPPVTPTP